MTQAARPGLGRLVSRHVGVLLVRNTVVSCFVFAIDLALLWVLVQSGGINTLLAATVAFIAANVLHYVLGRRWIFRGTERAVGAGLVYFLINAGIGLAITMALYAAILELTSIHYLVARAIVSVFGGLTVFYLNATLNFRSV
jgi:putative flippase GtrA